MISIDSTPQDDAIIFTYENELEIFRRDVVGIAGWRKRENVIKL